MPTVVCARKVRTCTACLTIYPKRGNVYCLYESLIYGVDVTIHRQFFQPAFTNDALSDPGA